MNQLLKCAQRMEELENAAERRDLSAFARAEESIDWTRHPAEDFIRAMDLAIAIGAPLLARRISEKGARQYPDNQTMRKYVRILAPPKILRADLPADPAAGADIRWLKSHGLQYRGRWVALRRGELLDCADSYEQLIAKVHDTAGVLLTRVP